MGPPGGIGWPCWDVTAALGHSQPLHGHRAPETTCGQPPSTALLITAVPKAISSGSCPTPTAPHLCAGGPGLDVELQMWPLDGDPAEVGVDTV